MQHSELSIIGRPGEDLFPLGAVDEIAEVGEFRGGDMGGIEDQHAAVAEGVPEVGNGYLLMGFEERLLRMSTRGGTYGFGGCGDVALSRCLTRTCSSRQVCVT